MIKRQCLGDWCISYFSVSIRSITDSFLITNPLTNLFACWWWESCWLNRTGNWASLHEADSETKLLGVMALVQQGKQATKTNLQPIGRWVKSGHHRQLSWCFAQAPCFREYRETGTWLSLWQGRCLLTKNEPPCDFKLCWGEKKTDFKCYRNKNAPPLHFLLSLCRINKQINKTRTASKCSACFWDYFSDGHEISEQSPQCQALTEKSLPLAII